MTAVTASQADTLKSFRRQIADANGTLKELLAKRRKFEAEMPVSRQQRDDLEATGSLDETEIIKLLVAERRFEIAFNGVSSAGPLISEREVFLCHQLTKLRQIVAEIDPYKFTPSECRWPLWASSAAPVSDRADAAIEEIDRLLLETTKQG